MVRRHAVVLSACAALTLSLSGCSHLPGAFSTDQGDYAAAARVWQDPWVAPLTQASAPGPGFGTNGFVDRIVGVRTTPYVGSVRAVARAELAVASAAGWSPTSSTCGEEIEVALAGPAEAVASLVVTRVRPGAEVRVTALTRHHLDNDWSVPEPVAQTCLEDGAEDTVEGDYVAPPGGSEPLRSDPLPDQDEVSWKEEELSAADSTLLKEVSADLTSRGLPTVPTPKLRTGMNQRTGGTLQVDLDHTTLTALAATLDGWDLTYTACGGGGPVRVTFVRSFAHGVAVASASLFRGANTLRVTLPVPEGPSPPAVEDIPPLTASPCLGDRVARLTVLGTPAVLPTEVTPIRN